MPELTIASYNVHSGLGPRGRGFKPFEVVEACRRLDADVLVLPESWAPDDGPSQHQQVAQALGMSVVCDVRLARAVLGPPPRTVGRGDTGGTGGWHLAALSRVPFRAAEVIPLRHLLVDPVDRAVLAFDVVVDGSALAVRGAHLPHLEFGVHLRTSALRRALPAPTGPAVFIGDMNMWGWTIDQITPRGWRRVVKGKTWPAHRPHSQIDHVLVTPSVEAVWGEVGPDLGSDHLPIRARLRW